MPTPTPIGRPGTFAALWRTDLPVSVSVLLQTGEVLVVGAGAAGLLDPATGQFHGTGSLPLDEDGATFGPSIAVPLRDGRVLLLGGFGAQFYDPSTGQFSWAGALGSHTFCAALRLSDGRVLLIGELPPRRAASPTTWVFDPASGKLARTGSLKTARDRATATLLPDGRVLVTGGGDGAEGGGGAYSSAELYDPVAGQWRRTGSMMTTRSAASAVLLNDGRVLVVGGASDGGDTLASAELYDPATGRFTPTGSMSSPRVSAMSVRLADGRVLVAGGARDDLNWLASAELYDPATGRFTPTGSMSDERVDGAAILLADGRVVVVGGSWSGTETAEIYWP